MFGKKKNEEEENSCAFCIYAKIDDRKYFCRRKKKEVEEEGLCGSFEYDLLKRTPLPFPAFTGLEMP